MWVPPSEVKLTRTERIVLQTVIPRPKQPYLTNKEAAEKLNRSEGAIVYHLSNIYSKTGTVNRTDLTSYSIHFNLIDKT